MAKKKSRYSPEQLLQYGLIFLISAMIIWLARDIYTTKQKLNALEQKLVELEQQEMMR